MVCDGLINPLHAQGADDPYGAVIQPAQQTALPKPSVLGHGEGESHGLKVHAYRLVELLDRCPETASHFKGLLNRLQCVPVVERCYDLVCHDSARRFLLL